MRAIQGLRKDIVRDFPREAIAEYVARLAWVDPAPPEVERYAMRLDKLRTGYGYPVESQIAQSLLALELEAVLERGGHLSDHVESYRRGRSPARIFADLRRYVSAYRGTTAKKEWRLGVLRFDVRDYCESIPNGPDSPLWPKLRAVGFAPFEAWLRKDFAAARGVPFGSPIAPPILNLYLADFDRALAAFAPGAFYRRFGDDMLVVTPETGRLGEIRDFIVRGLAEVRLAPNAEKFREFMWSARDRQSIEFLGRTFSFAGRLSLTAKKRRALLDEWKRFLRDLANAGVDPSRSRAERIGLFFDVEARRRLGHVDAPWFDLFEWVDDSDAVRNLSDRLRALYREELGHPPAVSLHRIWRTARGRKGPTGE